MVDGLHARLHDALLQLAGDEVQPLRGAHQVGVGPGRGVLDDLVAGEHELADEVHERVEQVHVDADAAVGDAAALRRGLGRDLVWALTSSAWVSSALSTSPCCTAPYATSSSPIRRSSPSRSWSSTADVTSSGVTRPSATSTSPSSGASAGAAGRLGRLLHAGRLQLGEPRDELVVVGVALAAGRLDAAEQAAHRVDHVEQRAGDLGGEEQLAVAQPGQQVLADVRDGLEPPVRQEAAGALDGVDGAEDAPEQVAAVRRLLEGDEVLVELVEVLVALDQELLDDLVHVVQRVLLDRGGVCPPCFGRSRAGLEPSS